MEHITEQILQEFIEKRLSSQETRIVSSHLSGCSSCNEQMKSYSLLHRTIKQIPLEKVSSDFTTQLLKKLNIKEAPSFLWNLLTNIAPLLLITVVLVILVGALQVSGALNTPEVSNSIQLTQKAYSVVSDGLTSGSQTVNSWLNTLFPFKFASEGLTFTIFLICFLSAIALLDKFLFIKLLRKR